MKRKSFFIVLLLGLFIGSTKAQDATVDLYGDFVSSYVWRGIKQAGASVQPSLSVGYKGFTLGAWGSTELSGDTKKEVDFTAGYSISNFSVSVTDYWWDGEYVERYFSAPKDGNAGHLLEVGLSYQLPEKYPLKLSWYSFVMGEGNKKADGKNSFSSYVEASYPFTFQEVDFEMGVGAIPWTSPVYGEKMRGFKVSSVKLTATREVKITDKFSVPIFANIIANPASEDMHFIFGFRLQ